MIKNQLKSSNSELFWVGGTRATLDQKFISIFIIYLQSQATKVLAPCEVIVIFGSDPHFGHLITVDPYSLISFFAFLANIFRYDKFF